MSQYRWQFATQEGGDKTSAAKAKKMRTQNKDKMSFRLDPEIKARVAHAAAINGQELTDFVVLTLRERADEILARHDSLFMSSKDYELFLNLLGGPQKTFESVARRR